MSYLDLLLSIIALLLWINWRTMGFALTPPALSLASTVRPADHQASRRWVFLVLLLVLLVLRALFYWRLADPLDWTPKLSLGVVLISFKCETLGRYLLFSLLSFLRVAAIFYAWLLLLSALQGRTLEPDSPTRFIRLHLGRLGRLPGWAQGLLPFPLAMLGWLPLYALLRWLDLAPAVSGLELAMDALRLGLAVFLAWKYLLLGLLVLHWINSYVYIGQGSIWPFVGRTGRAFLWPVQWLRLGKLDFAPLVGIALVIAVCYPIEHWRDLAADPKTTLPGIISPEAVR